MWPVRPSQGRLFRLAQPLETLPNGVAGGAGLPGGTEFHKVSQKSPGGYRSGGVRPQGAAPCGAVSAQVDKAFDMI